MHAHEADFYLIQINDVNDLGFSIANELLDIYKDARIIFVSNNEELIFETRVFHPYFFIRNARLEDDMTLLFHEVMKLFPSKSYIVRNHGKIRSIQFKDIVFIEKQHNQLIIHLTDYTTISQRKSIKEVQEIFLDAQFIKVNQGCIINIQYITDVDSHQVTVLNHYKFSLTNSALNHIQNTVTRDDE